MKKTTLSIAMATLLLSGSAVYADAWHITQVTTNNGASVTTVGQHGSTTNSLQGMNVINTAGTVTGSQEINASALTLEQTDTVTASTQAANYAKASILGLSNVAFLQKLKATGLTLSQTTSGANAVQGGNIIAQGDADINSEQGITDNATMTMTQTGTDSALQVGNGVITTPGGSGSTNNTIVQYVNVAGLDMDQNGASNSTQAANYVGPAQ